ncbi:unnamed protein product [Meloidogyne enterolobii]|uniref:Uncharacterized protein n=1 Tax=Meloidogyne enterolobii TaxID=390850 RepID=A0ACB1AC35_MELEN
MRDLAKQIPDFLIYFILTVTVISGKSASKIDILLMIKKSPFLLLPVNLDF